MTGGSITEPFEQRSFEEGYQRALWHVALGACWNAAFVEMRPDHGYTLGVIAATVLMQLAAMGDEQAALLLREEP